MIKDLEEGTDDFNEELQRFQEDRPIDDRTRRPQGSDLLGMLERWAEEPVYTAQDIYKYAVIKFNFINFLD